MRSEVLSHQPDECGGSVEVAPESGGYGGRSGNCNESGEQPADTGETIDVFVGFTTAAKQAEGGFSDIVVRCVDAQDDMNERLRNSGAGTKVRIVYLEEFNYSENGTGSTDLNRWRDAGDGYMDSMPSVTAGVPGRLVRIDGQQLERGRRRQPALLPSLLRGGIFIGSPNGDGWGHLRP